MFSLENVFIIMSRAVGYIAFITIILDELNHECSISMAFLKHLLDKSGLPDGSTLSEVSKIILKKACVNGYILWSLLAKRFPGHLTEAMWSDEVCDHLIHSIQFNHGSARLYALLSLESFAMTGNIKQHVMLRGIQSIFNRILLECNQDLQSTNSPFLTSHHFNLTNLPKSVGHQFVKFSFLPFMAKKKKKQQQQQANTTVVQKLSYQKKPSKHFTIKPSCTKQWSELCQIKYCIQWSLGHVFTEKKMNGSLDPKLIKHDNKLNEIRNDHPYLLQTICSSSMTTTLSGAWYYEVLLLTDGVVHIGWATPACQFIPEQAYGVGDNLHGFAFDSYRGVLWTSGKALFPDSPIACQAGDVVGSLLNLKKGTCTFFLNGKKLEFSIELSPTHMFPAVSLTSHQQIVINYGEHPWFYPPPNKTHPVCSLSKKEEKQQMIEEEEEDDTLLCILCYSEPKNTVLLPCLHDEFGQSCMEKLKNW
ncbi:hypothetical protein G6F62_010691 [Rhizopus arrhizus]|nr:hypothetical protein G6F62_010691 [Rhizopus arrhizus]